jgi:hypothetical protein
MNISEVTLRAPRIHFAYPPMSSALLVKMNGFQEFPIGTNLTNRNINLLGRVPFRASLMLPMEPLSTAIG